MLLLAGSTALRGQATAAGSEAGGGDIALTYQWVHSNTQPGRCGCFSLTGAGLSGSLRLSPDWAAVLEVNTGFASHEQTTGSSITLASGLAGVRYYPPESLYSSAHLLHPFGQALVGIARAGGGIAQAGDGTMALAGRFGGGLDLPVGQRLGLRLIEVEYYPTLFANGSNNRQNNFVAAAGVVFHWSRGG